MNDKSIRISIQRLMNRLFELAKIGAHEKGGATRIALTKEDGLGRDLLVSWMKELGLAVRVDQIGNIFGTRKGTSDASPVMIGSHLDTVGHAGIYDGNLGVLAGLEIVATLNDNGIQLKKPLTIASFSNEEGVRFQSDMMGSLAFCSGVSLEEAYAAKAFDDGTTLKQNLEAIGYLGDSEVTGNPVSAYLELHVEQGPKLDQEGITIGAVEGVQGLTWVEYQIKGVQNHAGTTPMHLRKDAGYVAAEIIKSVRDFVLAAGDNQVGTVGTIELKPNLINVMAEYAKFVIDLRNADEEVLNRTEKKIFDFAMEVGRREGVTIETKDLARFSPVKFSQQLVNSITAKAEAMDYKVKRMWSGAGHDAQMLARIAPTAMIFIPSKDGISHNVKEYSSPQDIECGTNLLLQVALDLAM